ncbi:MAG: 2,3-bisphosphoglycerate-independent phosphoglycerate mutase [Gemmatimonadota bacterium]|nr:MAG: 2,3-bisphosphoglycerate-independent phosphoglycerate mutase [Gemmatimonadota bacterium]
MRSILVVLDGLGDRGYDVFEGETPLQAAHTPHLDRIAALGVNGLYHSTTQGMAMPSETAHFCLFGYDIGDFPGRGPLEAIGENISMGDGDVALLARIYSVEEKGRLLVLRQENPEVDAETCRLLHKEVGRYEENGIEVEFVPTKGIQGILILRGEVSPRITDSNPIYEGRPLMEILPLSDTEKGKRTADVLNNYLVWCYQRLSRHPVNLDRARRGLPALNGVGTQRAGGMKHVPPFRERWGLKAMSIASGAVYHGLCALIGMDCFKVGDTDAPDKDLRERLRIAKETKDFDFVHVHTKAVDEASHTKSAQYKKDVIERIDLALAYALEEIIPDEEILFVVTSDHSTPSSGAMIHSGETVPLTMVGKYTRRDDVAAFNEISCAKGALGLVRGRELMHLILNFLDRAQLVGLRDSPVDRPYIVADAKPLRVR